MKRTFDRTQLGIRCIVCGKGAVMGVNKPNSQKRTKRVLKPNVHMHMGLSFCTRCWRTIQSKQAQSTVSS